MTDSELGDTVARQRHVQFDSHETATFPYLLETETGQDVPKNVSRPSRDQQHFEIETSRTPASATKLPNRLN